MDLLDQHERLQQIVLSFHQCTETHELALKRVTELECELREAHKAISMLESVIAREQTYNTKFLYDSLVGSESNPVCEPAVTIDLTGDDTIAQCPVALSKNKFRKYIRIKKLIKRSLVSIKKLNLAKKNVNLRRECINLVKQLSDCHIELEHSKTIYNMDTCRLQEELLCKEILLKDIFNKYEASQSQLSERMVEACELMDLVKYNSERFESLSNNLLCNCHNAQSPELQPSTPMQEAVQLHSVHPPECRPVTPLSLPEVARPESGCVKNVSNRSVIFTDKLGVGVGSILHNSLTHKVTNFCYPNLHYNQIIDKIVNCAHLNDQTTVILLIGNSIGLRKRDIVNGIETLLKLNIGKIMLCALPYSNSLSDNDNNTVHNLNNLIYMLTCHHNDKLLFFDTNKFVSNFTLTQEVMFLPKKYKQLIATLIAFNINSVIGSITQTSISDESVLLSYTNNTVINQL